MPDEYIQVSTRTLKTIAGRRKMDLHEVLGDVAITDGHATFESFAALTRVADTLCVPVAQLLVDADASDLDDGMVITRAGEGYSRTTSRNGVKYYTYHHLATTVREPDLMPLRLELHCRDEDAVTLNAGHDAREVVYITKGMVTMTWRHGDSQREELLRAGDSVYVQPGVPHSFMSSGDEDAELIAFNCGPSRPDYDLVSSPVA